MAQSDWQLLAVTIPFHSKNAIGEVTVCIGRDFYQIKWMREQYFGRCQWQLLLISTGISFTVAPSSN